MKTQKPNILSTKEIKETLKQFPGWKYVVNPPSRKASVGQGKISKEFKFADFMGSLNFVKKLASYCEKIDHHPDIHIFYNKVLFELQRFDVGGKVTDKDFMVALQIENLYKKSR